MYNSVIFCSGTHENGELTIMTRGAGNEIQQIIPNCELVDNAFIIHIDTSTIYCLNY